MCGIFGHTHGKSKPDIAASRKALNTLTHRGPDQWGEYNDEAVYIGHRRLSILDLSTDAQQPMVTKKPNGKKVIMSANGEIWNYRTLKKQLQSKYKFNSLSDCEILLFGYKEWGLNDLLNRIDGMYAFTIFDEETQKLHIIRDRYGIKPLYYTQPCPQTGQRVVYASEIKAILDLCPDLRTFSRKGVSDWLSNRGSWTGMTPYTGIHKLLPGHRLEIDVKTGETTTHQYHDLLDHIGETPSDPRDLDELFDAAIQKRLMSDVPLGLQLSGGVDSSLSAYSMRKAIIGAPIHSFSIGFSDESEQRYSEEPFARSVADQLNLTHHQININRRAIADNFEHVLWLCDGMLDFPNTIPIYLLSKFSKDHVSVHMTGEGADELFGGYGKFSNMLNLSKSKGYAPNPWIKMLGKARPEWGRQAHLKKHYGRNSASILNHLNAYISAKTAKDITEEQNHNLVAQVIGSDPAKQEKFVNLSFEKQLLLIDHKTYLQSVLERQDRGSMGASIESRVPFLDRNLVEWAVNLPENQLFDRKNTKVLLKQKAAKEFDPAFAHRRKMGFPLPIQSWMGAQDGLADFLDLKNKKDFLFYDGFNAASKNTDFDHTLLNYPDSQSQWTDWFGMILANTQKQFKITDISE